MGRQRGPAAAPAEEKTCASCGRRIEPRAKWSRDWDAVRWCSDACRRRGVTDEDRALEAALRERLRTGGVFDPAAMAGSGEPVRRAVRRLAAAGELEVLQGGHAVDPSTAKGPLRVRPL